MARWRCYDIAAITASIQAREGAREITNVAAWVCEVDMPAPASAYNRHWLATHAQRGERLLPILAVYIDHKQPGHLARHDPDIRAGVLHEQVAKLFFRERLCLPFLPGANGMLAGVAAIRFAARAGTIFGYAVQR